MNKEYMTKMKEFYLDISRYTFDLLDDNDLRQIIVVCKSDEELKAMSKLVKNAFFNQSKRITKFISLNVTTLGVEANYVDSCLNGMYYVEYEDIMFRYAYKDDKRIEHQIEKRLFEENLKFGFKEIKN